MFNLREARMAAIAGPSLVEERTLWQEGYRVVAGIDEVGRGPLAGPVVAAAVILPTDARPSWLRFVRDSKQLTARKRDYLFDCMERGGTCFGVGMVSPEVIDEKGIATATRLAMRNAVQRLSPLPDFLLIDYIGLPEVNIHQKSIVKGDRLSLSVAAASIVAKVVRDRFMVEMDGRFPGYGLARHKGYGTPQHMEMLQLLGPCPIHRRSFGPVRAFRRLV